MDAQVPYWIKAPKPADFLKGRQAKWNQAVEKAREILKHRKANQMMVVELALDVCDITRGGRKPEGTFTIRRFAQEIGVNHKTMSQWIGLYRMVYSKLPPDLQEKIKLVNIEDVARSSRHGASDHELTVRAREEPTPIPEPTPITCHRIRTEKHRPCWVCSDGSYNCSNKEW